MCSTAPFGGTRNRASASSSVATIDCVIEAEHEAGDHWFVVGRVDSMSHADAADNAMVFFRGKVVAANYPNT